MPAYTIEAIREKRTRKGRVEYFIKWEGYPDSDNTWETRMDLIKDGHQTTIKQYEKEQKGSTRSRSRSRSTEKRSTSRSRSKSAPRSPRSRSKSAPRSPRSPRSPKTPRSSKAPRSPRTPTSAKKSASKPMKTSPETKTIRQRRTTRASDGDEEEETDTEKSSEFRRGPDLVSHYVDSLSTEWVKRVVWIVIIFFLLVAEVCVPAIRNMESDFPVYRHVISIGENASIIVSAVCTYMAVQSQYSSAFSQSIQIGFVWRTAGEVLLQIAANNSHHLSLVYRNAALGCYGIADFCLLWAIISLVGGKLPQGDVLTSTLCILGTLGIYATDAICYLLVDSPLAGDRGVIIGLSMLLLSVSHFLQLDKN